MDLKLVMFKADGKRREFPITHPVTIVGRKHTCDLRVPISSVSREHCQVELRDDGAYIRDLGSSNGTYHQDARVNEGKLGAGDTIVVGPCHFFVVIDGEPGDIEPVPTVLPGGGEVQELNEIPDEPPSVTAEAEPDDAMAALSAAADEEGGSAGDADDDALALEIEPGETFDDDDDDAVVPAFDLDDDEDDAAEEATTPPPPPPPAPKKPAAKKPAKARPDSPTKSSPEAPTTSGEAPGDEDSVGLAVAGGDDDVKANTDDALAAMLGGGEAEVEADPFAALDALANAGDEATEDDALAWLEEDDDDK